ncbi:DUF397 domain-containing protein [Streptomyces cyaneofuscatus]|uniref:DUF397 domain-containing protein n=1 Tax=Streptomyces TaxID=1883 RepID=UPI0004C53B48|nr:MULTISPECIES: DUF397 domain-containing protein [Streptomyces]ONI52197.1 hypothetical protein STIB_35930 [Streptomyces sp. IB2014 011-1]RDV50541.1 DUF397 domain-containing protein [Streptomyces sp. IB2014 011-12]CAD5967054.1 conserved protein of unknown function [Streptomyces sp. KY75]CAD5976464.1 conserved protein of unknown function [Streptomyces sp. KY70]
MSSTLRWFKSSYSSSSGGDCIEVAFDWRTSSYSSGSGGECVEVAACPHAVHIRDSKVTDGPAFAVAPDAWSAFVTWAD